jgi:hypothetical protein
MVSLSQLVNESLARHGVRNELDHRRLQWSNWFRLESNFKILLAPSKPGIFALAEQIPSAAELSATSDRITLALLQIAQSEDIGMSLGRLFLPGTPEQRCFNLSRCYARYAVVEDARQRQSACAALERWMASAEPHFVAPGSPAEGGFAAGNSWGLGASDGSPPPQPIGGRAPLPPSS